MPPPRTAFPGSPWQAKQSVSWDLHRRKGPPPQRGLRRRRRGWRDGLGRGRPYPFFGRRVKPGAEDRGARSTGRLQLADRRFGARDLELPGGLDVDLLDDAVLDDHREALVPRAEAELRAVHLEAELPRELAVTVREHHHLARGSLGLSPRVHHEGIVHGDAGDEVDALRLDGVGVLDVAGQVLVRAGGGEGARHAEEDDLLSREQLLRGEGG